MNKEPTKWEKRGSTVRKMSLAMAIPSLFVGSPLGVGAVGYFAGRYFANSPRTGFIIGFALGFAIALRETVRILKKLSK